MEYKEYLKSEHWRNIREWALERADNKCQICKSEEKLNVHHNDYSNLGKEKPSDLIVLCENCHNTFHDSLPTEPKEEKSESQKEKIETRKKALLNEIRTAEKPFPTTALSFIKTGNETNIEVERRYYKNLIAKFMMLDIDEEAQNILEQLETTKNDEETISLLRQHQEIEKLKSLYNKNHEEAFIKFNQKYPDEIELLSRLF